MITIDNRSGFELSYATAYSAGFDLRATEDVDVAPGATVLVPTGVYIEKADWFDLLEVRPRSGLASRGLWAILGTVDAEYRGEIMVIFHNSTKCFYHVEKGDKIAQAVCTQYSHAMGVNINKVERGSSGFGSSGK